MQEYVDEILLSPEEILTRVNELGKSISQDYRGIELFLIGILRGSFVFIADLVRNIDIPVILDFMAISSYGGNVASSGVVKILKDLDENISGRHVLIVEDIIDTGLTLGYLFNILRARKPESLKICTLLDRSARRIVDLPIAYAGFKIPDTFVVGYGLDYRQRYRNLPYIAKLRLVNE
ncbi:MAG: hypoxanthine phosphoribosyltransferase [Candidatus Tectomicrobia bacterium]|uniref:Hypoxanthine phosphoribosyltransferase n=1 Tax=Tectimicrobiota bacterium TaxID=2528274 RepID=A0A933GMG0_UNCTE|nr:hypoxanthine phosphoribosyltransferase [Candidatus Tectomicrobia bacterium]